MSLKSVKIGPGSSGTISHNLAEGDYIQLEVVDTGCGMSEETQARVFDPFFTTKSAGRGLGLAVVQGIVRTLNGLIHVTSQRGEGPTFQILLPSAETTILEGGSGRDAEQSASASTEGVILVVEDEGPLRQAVVKTLRNAGFKVFEAADGSAAIDLIRVNESNINAILLDVTMPGPSHGEILDEAAKARPDVRVVITSAYSRERIADAGAMNAPQVCGFIRKPFKLADLVEALRNALCR